VRQNESSTQSVDDCKLTDASRQVAVSANLEEDEDGSSCCETSDFESMSSERSEIPEAILEDSSSESSSTTRGRSGRPRRNSSRGRRASDVRVHSMSGETQLPGTVFEAWVVLGNQSPSSEGVLRCARSRRPVRRGRVRGTVCLPTSAVSFSPPTRSPPAASPSPEAERSPALDYENARLELERESAARRADASEEALQAERASYEAELARKAQEAADNQALLQALHHDRAELAIMYRKANQELCRLRAELSQRTVELLEIRQERGDGRQLLPAQNNCVVCLESKATMALVPCGHLSLCQECSSNLDGLRCPVCRQPSESMLHIFMP